MRNATIALALLLLSPVLPLAGADHGPVNPTCSSGVGKDVVLVIDRSSSMLDQDKMTAAKTAADALLATLSPTLDQSALVSFSSGFTLDKGLDFLHTTAQHSTLSTEAKVDALVADGATSLGGAIKLARYELDNGLPSPAPNAPYSGNARQNVGRIMVVLSDGDQTVHHANPVTEANYAKTSRNITIYAVALGTALSANGLSVLENVSSSPAHFYVTPDPSDLAAIFEQISLKLQDAHAPTVQLTRPSPTAHRLYRNDADWGPSQLPGETTVVGTFTLRSAANDDCHVERVDYFVDGAFAGSSNQSSTYPVKVDCDALAPGRHEVRAVAHDWLGKTAEARGRFWCVRAHVDAQSTSLYVRATQPADPLVRTEGARVAGVPSADAHDVWRQAGTAPVPHDLSWLHDDANASIILRQGFHPAHLFAQAHSRQASASLPTLALRVDALETRAFAQADADVYLDLMGAGTRFAVKAGAQHGVVDVDHPTLDALLAAAPQVCVSDLSSALVRVERCAQEVELGPGVALRVGETITLTGPAWQEVTVNGLHLLVDRPETRAELILSQSYAGASWIGPQVLMGPWRELDRESDAGSHADAPPGPLAADALPLAPGTYGARLHNASDVDAYAIAATPGQKVHALVSPSAQARTTLGTFSPLPTTPGGVLPYAASLPSRAPTTTAQPAMTVRLLDPAGLVRDSKTTLAGAPAAVELNVDVAGTWVVQVLAAGPPGDYALQLTRADAPMTQDDDALLGEDAGGSCADALLVGPGAHVGTLEDADAADWYRFPLAEGQVLALTLRPGDTLEAADMRLRFFGRACEPIALGAQVLPGVKGSPEVVTWTVPTGMGGLYRAEVAHVNGLGTYELAVATSVAATP